MSLKNIDEQIVIKKDRTVKDIYIELEDNSICVLEDQNYNFFDIGDEVKFLGYDDGGIFKISVYSNMTKGLSSITGKLNASIFLLISFILGTLFLLMTLTETSKYSDGYTALKGLILFSTIGVFIQAYNVYDYSKNKKWLLDFEYMQKIKDALSGKTHLNNG